MNRTHVHPLENNAAARVYFTESVLRTAPMAAAAYRHAVETLTGSLPTWAQRQRAGRKPAPRPAPLEVYSGDQRTEQ